MSTTATETGALRARLLRGVGAVSTADLHAAVALMDGMAVECQTLATDRDEWISAMRFLLVDLEVEAIKVLNGELDGAGLAYLLIDWCADIGLDVPGSPYYEAPKG